jgi:predicted signal transduction protein with EAL and GGDEF domain
VIAEGIEQPQQAERLRAMRSPLGQGFLFARPLAVDQVEALLEATPAGETGGIDSVVVRSVFTGGRVGRAGSGSRRAPWRPV